MNVGDLLRQPHLWACGAGDDGIAASSRVRLARNLRGHAFPDWAGEDENLRVWRTLEPVLRALPSMEGSVSASNEEMADLDRQILVERHLASREHARKGRGSGIVLRVDERLSVMVNEEDHLRMQSLECGLRLHEVWERMEALDREFEERIACAFSPRLGYLTACPTNVGTGLRASVMLHVPGLVLMEEMAPVVNGIQKLGLAVRGLWGEGTEAVGNMFQISNQMTLGAREEDLVGDLDRLVREVIDHERNARARLMRSRETVVRDHVGRALGILGHAYVLTSNETLSHLSALRLGIELGIVERLDRATVDALLLLTQPAHIQRAAGRPLGPRERDEARARLVRERLGEPPRRRRVRKTKE